MESTTIPSTRHPHKDVLHTAARTQNRICALILRRRLNDASRTTRHATENANAKLDLQVWQPFGLTPATSDLKPAARGTLFFVRDICSSPGRPRAPGLQGDGAKTVKKNKWPSRPITSMSNRSEAKFSLPTVSVFSNHNASTRV